MATVLHLGRDVGKRLRSGHPWIYRDALLRSGRTPPAGAVVDVHDARGAFVGRGFHDPDSPIAVRLLTRDAAERVDDDLVARRVAAACALRRMAAALIDSDAVRLLHGEADLVPGLTLDAYLSTGVVRLDGAAAAAFWRPHTGVIVEACRAAGFPLDRLWARAARSERGEAPAGRALVGDPPPLVVVREGAARYEVDVVHGQKTGFFLDQRDNRRLVGSLAAGAEVLNLFAYTGGFSVAAALGGARRVTTVEIAGPALEAARRNLALNAVPLDAHELVQADAFEFLERARAAGRRWDVVVCDPPSFAPSERARPAALAAYRRLNRLALEVVAADGLLATASCSSHVTRADLIAQVAAASIDAHRTARLLDVRAAGPDHPVLPAFPEGDYLVFLLLRVS